MKDVLGGGTMKEFIAVRPKMFTSLTDDGHVDVGKVRKRYKKSVIKREIKFQHYKDCLESKK